MRKTHEKEAVKALRRAVEKAGSQGALARLISTPKKPVTQQHIWNWIHRDKVVPPQFVLDIERATGVPRIELARDVFSERKDAA